MQRNCGEGCYFLKNNNNSEEMDSYIEKRIKFKEEMQTYGAGLRLPDEIKRAVFEAWVTFTRSCTRNSGLSKALYAVIQPIL